MSYWYLASPYSKYPLGQEAAWRDVCREAALLLRHGISVFSPIAHTHPIAEFGALDKFDHDFWFGHDETMMRGALGMIECRMAGWKASYGMAWEREWFEAAAKPVIVMTPGEVPAQFREAV